jgi:hypothetical protein
MLLTRAQRAGLSDEERGSRAYWAERWVRKEDSESKGVGNIEEKDVSMRRREMGRGISGAKLCELLESVFRKVERWVENWVGLRKIGVGKGNVLLGTQSLTWTELVREMLSSGTGLWVEILLFKC